MSVAWFISDLHLTDMQERRSQVLLRFLSLIHEQKVPATHLFLLGDIFDLWVGDQQYFEKKFFPFVERIRELKKRNIQIFYIEGNHDVHIQDYWIRQGIFSAVEAQLIDIDFGLIKQKIRIEHGDLINQKDTAYLNYRDFLRSAPLKFLSDQLPGFFIQWLGHKASQESRKHSQIQRQEHAEDLRQMLREHALRVHKEDNFDFIVSGHMHVRDEWQCLEKGFSSFNLGSWFDQTLALKMSLDESQNQNPQVVTEWVDVSLL